MSENATYRTRYGKMTAEQAAVTLLDRACARLTFLRQALEKGSDSDEEVDGLVNILEDIAFDVNESRWYCVGLFEGGRGNATPGKIDDDVAIL